MGTAVEHRGAPRRDRRHGRAAGVRSSSGTRSAAGSRTSSLRAHRSSSPSSSFSTRPSSSPATSRSPPPRMRASTSRTSRSTSSIERRYDESQLHFTPLEVLVDDLASHVETGDDGRVRYRYSQSAVVAAYGEMASAAAAFRGRACPDAARPRREVVPPVRPPARRAPSRARRTARGGHRPGRTYRVLGCVRRDRVRDHGVSRARSRLAGVDLGELAAEAFEEPPVCLLVAKDVDDHVLRHRVDAGRRSPTPKRPRDTTLDAYS